MQRVEADLGEGDDPSTQQMAMTAEPDVAAAAVMLSLLCRARERARRRVE